MNAPINLDLATTFKGHPYFDLRKAIPQETISLPSIIRIFRERVETTQSNSQENTLRISDFTAINSQDSTLKNRLEGLRQILERILILINEEPEDDFVYDPKEIVFKQFKDIVKSAYFLVNDSPIVKPIIAPDGIGGLKFDWRKSFTNEVRLYISPAENRPSYIYFKLGEKDGVIQNPTAEHLALYLKKMND